MIRPSRWIAAMCGLLLLATAVEGCGDDDESGSEPREAAEEQPEEDLEPAEPEPPSLPSTPIPQSYGLHLYVDDELRPLSAGDPEWVHPTNADRGFGFERPHGPAIGSTRPLFVLKSGNMQLSTIRLSRYEPYALLPELWWTTSEKGRAAWLPEILVPVESERDPDHAGLVRVRPVDALAPGFYVLHDGSLIRGRQRDELSAWFPFQVFPREQAKPPNPDSVWYAHSTECLPELTQLIIDNHIREVRAGEQTARLDRQNFVRTQGPRLRRCANELHAVMMAVEDPALRDRARAALVALHTLHNGFEAEHAATVLAATEPALEAGPLLEYWLETGALENARALQRALAQGNVDEAGDHAVKLSSLYLLDGRTRADAQAHLLWFVFALDPDWEPLDEVSARLATGVDPYEEVAILLAAHHARRLALLKTRHSDSPLKDLVDEVLARYPEEILAAREGLAPGHSNSVVALGPLHSTDQAVDPMALQAVEQWLTGRKPALESCYQALAERSSDRPRGVLLVDVMLSTSVFGSEAKLQVRGIPVPGGQTATLGDDSFLTCIESDALKGLPADLLAISGQLTMPVVFGSTPAALDLR